MAPFGGQEGMEAALKAARAEGIGVDEETLGAINSVQEMINTLPHDHPARAQLDDMLSALQAGTVAPNQVQNALAHVRDTMQNSSSGAADKAFKASLINHLDAQTQEIYFETLEKFEDVFEKYDVSEETQEAAKRYLATMLDSNASPEQKQAARQALEDTAERNNDSPEAMADIERIAKAAVEKARENGVEVANAATSNEIRQVGTDTAALMRESQQAILDASGNETDVARVQSAVSAEFIVSAAEALEANDVSSAFLRTDVAQEQNEKAQAVLAVDSSEQTAGFVGDSSIRTVDKSSEALETQLNFDEIAGLPGISFDMSDASLNEPLVPKAAPNLVADSNEINAPTVS